MEENSLEHLFSQLHTQDSLLECNFLTTGGNGATTEAEIKLLYQELMVLKDLVALLPQDEGEAVLQWRNKLAMLWNRLISVKKNESACRIHQKLIVIEYAVVRLFSINPMPLELLKERLRELEDLISYLPFECINLSVIWREKITNFWLQVSAANSYTLRPVPPASCDNFSFFPLEDGLSSDIFTGPSTHSIVSPSENSNFRQFWHPFMTSTMAQNEPLQIDIYNCGSDSCGNNVSNQEYQGKSNNENKEMNNHQSKEDSEQISESNMLSNDHAPNKELVPVDTLKLVLKEIQNSFSLLKYLKSGSDVDGMKSLLNTISSTGKLALPFHYHTNHLKTEIFNCTISKLTHYKRKQFRKRFGDDRYPLSNLIRMLLVDIAAATLRDSNENNQVSTSQFISDGNVRCIICQTRGHRIRNCPFISMMLCSKCFEFGHFGKHCQYRA